MKINIQFVRMPTSETMDGYMREKLAPLSKKYEWLTTAEVFFKKEHKPKGKGKICEVQLSLPGPRIFASSNEKNFEMAVKETISDLEKQLKKRKQEMNPYI
jgi:putative sigma-54 modulation protein